MKRFKIKKFFMILGIAILATVVFGFVVMSLWNAILPAVLGVKAVSFWQALGILVLSKILFGGFGRGGGAFARRRHEWKNQVEQKLAAMTPEEREQFKAEWKNRCGSMRWPPFQQNSSAAE